MGVARSIDLNADLGERYDGWQPGVDDALLAVVTTAHIACGFHSGDPDVMVETVRAAAARGAAVGAHPSYPDREGFGRRPMDLGLDQVRAAVLYQVGALQGIARAEGATVVSVKPHGSLYNRMAVEADCARAVAEAVQQLDPNLWLVVPAGTPAVDAARSVGVRVAQEAFCDRTYQPDGTLTSRGAAGAVLTDPEAVQAQAVRLAHDHCVEASDGSILHLEPDTLCIHGDTPGAADLAGAVRRALEAHLEVSPFAAR